MNRREFLSGLSLTEELNELTEHTRTNGQSSKLLQGMLSTARAKVGINTNHRRNFASFGKRDSDDNSTPNEDGIVTESDVESAEPVFAEPNSYAAIVSESDLLGDPDVVALTADSRFNTETGKRITLRNASRDTRNLLARVQRTIPRVDLDDTGDGIDPSDALDREEITTGALSHLERPKG